MFYYYHLTSKAKSLISKHSCFQLPSVFSGHYVRVPQPVILGQKPSHAWVLAQTQLKNHPHANKANSTAVIVVNYS